VTGFSAAHRGRRKLPRAPSPLLAPKPPAPVARGGGTQPPLGLRHRRRPVGLGPRAAPQTARRQESQVPVRPSREAAGAHRRAVPPARAGVGVAARGAVGTGVTWPTPRWSLLGARPLPTLRPDARPDLARQPRRGEPLPELLGGRRLGGDDRPRKRHLGEVIRRRAATATRTSPSPLARPAPRREARARSPSERTEPCPFARPRRGEGCSRRSSPTRVPRPFGSSN
jgi:hypothetical protein